MESITGWIFTGILALGIAFLTLRGFKREIDKVKNGSCCGSECGCDQCGGKCNNIHEIMPQDLADTKNEKY